MDIFIMPCIYVFVMIFVLYSLYKDIMGNTKDDKQEINRLKNRVYNLESELEKQNVRYRSVNKEIKDIVKSSTQGKKWWD